MDSIDVVLRHTNYTEEEARTRLLTKTYIEVIREYMTDDAPVRIGCQKTTSINQEIYKQIRTKLNEGIKEYNMQQSHVLQEELKS